MDSLLKTCKYLLPGYHLYFALLIVSAAMKGFFLNFLIKFIFYIQIIKGRMYLVRMRLTYIPREPLKPALERIKVGLLSMLSLLILTR